MSKYTIYPLILMYIEQAERSVQAYLRDFGMKIEMPVVCWLVQGCGKNILVDSGVCSAELAEKNHYPVRQTPEMRLANQLRAYGVDPNMVDTIILTHLHWDHCYNLELFPNTNIYVQKRELEYAVDPLPDHDLVYEGPKSGIYPSWLDHRNRFEVVDGDFTLC